MQRTAGRVLLRHRQTGLCQHAFDGVEILRIGSVFLDQLGPLDRLAGHWFGQRCFPAHLDCDFDQFVRAGWTENLRAGTMIATRPAEGHIRVKS